jgi:acid stress chaperone HdeB
LSRIVIRRKIIMLSRFTQPRWQRKFGVPVSVGFGGPPMKIFAAAAAAATLLAWVTPALAEDIDLSTWTCKQFQSASKDDIGVILAWLDGYYKEEDQPPVIDTDALVAKAKKLGQYCAEHPDSDLIGATDKLFQKQ